MKLRYTLILCCICATCNTTSKDVNRTAQTNSNIPSSDSRLVELIKLFSEDVGERGQTAFQEIRSRQNVVDELVSLSRRLPPDDPLQPQIAFVLSNLGHEYESNALVVSSALSKDPKFKDFDADQAASLLVRLINRGDKKRLPQLLRSADWSDGALSEIIGDEVSDQLLHDTAGLLALLSAEPESLRMKVYGLIHNSGSLNADDKKLIRTRLQQIERKSSLFPVARELHSSEAMR